MSASLDFAVSTLTKMNRVSTEEKAHDGLFYLLAPDAKSGIRASNKSNTMILFGDLAALCTHLGHVYQGFSTLQAFSLNETTPSDLNTPPDEISSEELDLLVLNSNRTVIHRAFIQESLKRLIAFGLDDTHSTELCLLFDLPAFGVQAERDNILDALMTLRESGLSDNLTDQVCQYFKLDSGELQESGKANVFEMGRAKV